MFGFLYGSNYNSESGLGQRLEFSSIHPHLRIKKKYQDKLRLAFFSECFGIKAILFVPLVYLRMFGRRDRGREWGNGRG